MLEAETAAKCAGPLWQDAAPLGHQMAADLDAEHCYLSVNLRWLTHFYICTQKKVPVMSKLQLCHRVGTPPSPAASNMRGVVAYATNVGWCNAAATQSYRPACQKGHRAAPDRCRHSDCVRLAMSSVSKTMKPAMSRMTYRLARRWMYCTKLPMMTCTSRLTTLSVTATTHAPLFCCYHTMRHPPSNAANLLSTQRNDNATV